jgi:ssDNA-binding Zn-finger/Zn-ribbon topoisomerase 1
VTDPDFQDIERDREQKLADPDYDGSREEEPSTECPNCGTTEPPRVSVRGDITYFNCPECDYSSWSRQDYER